MRGREVTADQGLEMDESSMCESCLDLLIFFDRPLFYFFHHLLTWRTVWPRYVMTEASCFEFALREEVEDELPFFPFCLPPPASKCLGTLCHLEGGALFCLPFLHSNQISGASVLLLLHPDR